MKTYIVYSLFVCVIFIFAGCKKSGGGNPTPPPAGAKAWLVKDISFLSLDCTSPVTKHRIFIYNDKTQITRITDSSACGSEFFDIVYDANGKITKFVATIGSAHTILNIHYNNTGQFVNSVVYEDSIHNSTTLYSWNLHSNNELDEKILTGGPFIFGRPKSIFYDYAYTGNAFHGQDSHIDGSPVQTDITVFSEGIGTALSNPFHIGRTPEQIFIYYYFALFSPDLLLGNSLPNGTFVTYFYTTGTREARAHFNYTYTLDSNNNIATITQNAAQDAPNFGTFVKGTTYHITYEQH
jgi:hypothetical protein